MTNTDTGLSPAKTEVEQLIAHSRITFRMAGTLEQVADIGQWFVSKMIGHGRHPDFLKPTAIVSFTAQYGHLKVQHFEALTAHLAAIALVSQCFYVKKETAPMQKCQCRQ